MASATSGRLCDHIATTLMSEERVAFSGATPYRTGAPAAKTVTDCRGVIHITAQALFGGGSLGVEQMLSTED